MPGVRLDRALRAHPLPPRIYPPALTGSRTSLSTFAHGSLEDGCLRCIRYALGMNRETLLRRRDRTHAIVEGALLGDIAIVFLLMRAFLPLPGVRQLLRAIATVPFVMLTQRRGVRLTILAAMASYILFSALVGPLLALAAVDIAVAGILAGIGRKFGPSPAVTVIWTGVVYSILDLLIPTIASVYIFQYPIKKLAQAARNFVNLVFNFVLFAFRGAHASAATIHSINVVKAWSSSHWLVPWFGSLALLGLLTMYLAVLVAETVLRQIPDQTLARRQLAA